jgi:polyhydroxybutyrate depolymerase
MTLRIGRIVCALAAALVVFGACAGSRVSERVRDRQAMREAGSNATEGAVSLALRAGGIDRNYLLFDGRRGSEPAPLVIALHGGGGGPESMISRWENQARTAGLVIAAPKGIGRTERGGTWNATGCCGEAVARAADDIGFVAAIIDDVSKRTSIDPKRVYVVGFSNGGMLTHRIAIALGERVAAAAVVSGALFGNEAPARVPVPLLIMHGEQDPVVVFNGGMSPTGFVADAQTLPFKPVRFGVDYWRAANGCTAPPSVTTQPGVAIERSTQCRNNAEVVFYDLPQGEHNWPGSIVGQRSRRSAKPAEIASVDATSTIWAFFQEHTR